MNFSGGNVMGTRRMVLKTPFSPRIFQNVTLLRMPRISGLERGMLYFPSDRTRLGLPMRAEERSGR